MNSKEIFSVNISDLCLLIIHSKKRNTFCSLVDSSKGNVITSCSTGVLPKSGFSDSHFVRVTRMANFIYDKLSFLKYKNIFVISHGFGPGNTILLNALKKYKFVVCGIVDNKYLPHNGCRPKKNRRKNTRTRRSYWSKRNLKFT